MDNLGTMNPEQILQLLTGSVACAFVIFLFTIVYIMISRRGRRTAKRESLGTPSFGQETSFAEYRAGTSLPASSSVTSAPSGLMVGQPLSDDETAPIDVSARLVGTGREAWQEDGPTSSPEPSAADEYAPDQKQEVLRLLRDPLTGQFWVQVAGVRYRSLKGIRDRAVGERVLAAVTHLLRFSNGLVATDQGVMTLELPPCDAVKVPTAFGVLSEARESVEVMRLMSDPDQDQFCVHVVGQCYHRLVDVSQRDTGRYILEAITRFLQFSGGMLATNDGVEVVPVPPLSLDVHTPLPRPATTSQVSEPAASTSSATSQPAQPTSGPPGPATTMGEEERLLQQMVSGTPSQPQTPVERPSLIGSLRRMRQGSSSAEILPPLNLADEIDRIFQSKLMASGLAATDAKVETNPDTGVRIRIGMDYYDSPDEVSDPNLRDLLKLSIAEWEQG
jgi:hypothetical protein